MRISIHPGNLFTVYGINGGFRLLHENGIEAIQFGMGSLIMSAETVRKNEPSVMDGPLEDILEAVRPYKEAAKAHNVAISQVHAPYPSWVSGREDINERMVKVLEKAVAVAEYMDCGQLVVHPPFPAQSTENKTAEEEWEMAKALYVPLIPLLKKHKVMCLLENMFSRGVEGVRYAAVCSDFSQAAAWIDGLNEIAGEECFGFCFDTGHCYLARQNIYRALHLMGSRVRALHMQDNDGHLDMHIAPYAGYIDWESFLDALRDIGYAGDLNFEAPKAINRYPKEMSDICVRMLARTGEYFRNRILGEKNS